MAKQQHESVTPRSNVPETKEMPGNDTVDAGDHEEMTPPPDFAQVIGDGVALCMRDRVNLRVAEASLDTWFRTLPQDHEERVAALHKARQQVETAKQAVEALYTRFRGSAVTARN